MEPSVLPRDEVEVQPLVFTSRQSATVEMPLPLPVGRFHNHIRIAEDCRELVVIRYDLGVLIARRYALQMTFPVRVSHNDSPPEAISDIQFTGHVPPRMRSGFSFLKSHTLQWYRFKFSALCDMLQHNRLTVLGCHARIRRFCQPAYAAACLRHKHSSR